VHTLQLGFQAQWPIGNNPALVTSGRQQTIFSFQIGSCDDGGADEEGENNGFFWFESVNNEKDLIILGKGTNRSANYLGNSN